MSLPNLTTKERATTMITMEQFTEMKDAMDVAQKDDTPFISTSEDEIHVFGDPNKTEVKSADYVVRFAFPDTPKWKKRVEAMGDKLMDRQADGYICVERTYKDARLAPRDMGNAVTAMTLIEQFTMDITENGEVKPLSYDEMKSVLFTMNHEITDATYELVSSVLRISPEESEWMLPVNALENAISIVINNPSLVNEADLFFG